MKRLFALAFWVVGAILLSQGTYMSAKAKLAQILISYSWQQRTADSPPPKPWWWADTKAIAKLQVPRLKQGMFVMQDSSGESLAFGPGHMVGSAQPASDGHVMIAGHRDSHFAFLRNIKIGDVINTTHYDSQSKHYRVTDIEVMDTRKQGLGLSEHNRLTLVTCYPFDQVIPGGPMRFVVNAQEVFGPLENLLINSQQGKSAAL